MKKKIAFVIPSLQTGGMERVMSELLKQFHINYDLELHLVLYGKTRGVFYKVPDSVIIHKPQFQFSDKLRFWHTLKTLFFLRRKLKSLNAKAILSFGEYWNNLVLLSTYGLSLPVFISDRSQPGKTLGIFHNHLRKWLYPKAKGIIVQSDKAKEIYQQMVRLNNIRVIGNPIREITNNLPIERENIVLSVGRLINTKNFDLLISMFIKVKEPGWRLIIVGDDAIKQKNRIKLQTLINDLNVGDRVVLAGNRSDVEKFYLKSKLFAFTSSSEGFPNVIGEALSAGLPVVAFNCIAGPSEMIVDGENGFLVPIFNETLFMKKLFLLMQDKDLRQEMSIHAQQSINKYSASNIANDFYNFMMK